MIDAIKNFIGEKWVTIISIAGIGFVVAFSYPSYLMTPETFAQEKASINKKIDVNVASLKQQNSQLELSMLRKEKNDILDLIDAGKAKQRHLDRLQEINDRMKTLQAVVDLCQKIMEQQ
jgi:hypothetical protein